MKDERLLEMRVFKTVVETGGFTAAANVLNVSQPFVSQSVNNLERRLGVQLLHRSTRTMRLTGEGERFLRSCNEILETLEEAEAQVRSSEPTGNLRVSAPHAFGMDQLVPQLPRFLAAYPKLCVHFSLSDSNVNLIEDNFDIAVRMGRLQDSSLRSRKLCNLQRIVVASPAYLAAHGQPVTPQGLTKHTCLTWESPREHLNQWPFMINGKLERVAVRGSFRSTDGTTLFQLCVAGVGIMRLAEHLALPAIRRGELVRLLCEYEAKDDTAIHIVYLPERQVVPRIRAFIDHFADAFRTPPWQTA
ncbi:LysR family transcriptional regulator (plasmid) [Burkholderia sp. KK1]|uniref:LysR family transcriptional regulator n=1 Tax=unclassified Caballeronia TaxID=2646786 RepID=UPI000979B3D6|nr:MULTISPECIES: LysR family transcriptional regulator [unclassified Caballeronia]AQH03894.1 LysR family transcriptional regulator [Burkholderia sp. KK1]MCE4545806.1 LysR family transcriptional regulator [Caballeronia sp. PC1]MCE4572072.1 LysR family transcriptional regulator [Caballeronia sp. CLC5]